MAQRFWPLERGHIITSGFGPRWGSTHWGTDFGWDGGSGDRPVYAVQGGAVLMVGPASGFGQWVVVDHPASDGGGTTVYGHVIPEVKLGQRVEAGQRIARINPDQRTNGGVAPHLHLEWHRYVWVPPGSDRLDPAQMLVGARYPNERQEKSMTLFGVDISNWQKGLDLAQVKREDFRAVIAKVSEGSGFRDATWPGFRDAARKLGFPIMGYHYLRANNSIEAQADTFVSHLGDKSIPCMIDAEIGSGGVREIRAFRDAVEARGVRVPLMYLPRWYWSGHIGSPDLSGLPPLMSSHYGPGNGRAGYASAIYPGDADAGWQGYGGLDVAVFQFTEKARVAGQAIDAWAFRGSEADLRALFSGTQTTKEKPVSIADAELAKRFPSRSIYRAHNDPIDTLAGFVLNIDARIHEEFVEQNALLGIPEFVDVVKRVASEGAVGDGNDATKRRAQAILDQIGE